jgi:hypothetical protein
LTVFSGGELDLADLAEFPGHVVSELLHRRLVVMLEFPHRPLVVVGPVRREQHPDPQVSRLDLRVVTVLQQHHLPHRAARETLSGLRVDLAFNVVQPNPVHRGRPIGEKSTLVT